MRVRDRETRFFSAVLCCTRDSFVSVSVSVFVSVAAVCARRRRRCWNCCSRASSRWRLNRVAADLSVIFGVRQAYFKQHAFGDSSSSGGSSSSSRRRAGAGVHGRDNDDDGDTSSPGWGRGRENSVAAVEAYSGGPNANDDDGYDYGYGGDGGGHRYADGGRVGAAWRGRRREDNDPWARPLQSYELKPLVLLWRFASRRLDGVLEAAWNRYANSNKNKNKNNQQEEREQEQRQKQVSAKAAARGWGAAGHPSTSGPSQTCATSPSRHYAAPSRRPRRCAPPSSPGPSSSPSSPTSTSSAPDRWFVFSSARPRNSSDEWW